MLPASLQALSALLTHARSGTITAPARTVAVKATSAAASPPPLAPSAPNAATPPPKREDVIECSSASLSSAAELCSKVTVILVTSFTPACPATALIEATLASFAFVPGLELCSTVIVCDGYVASSKRRTKAGRLISEDEAPYRAYIDALRKLVDTARSSTPAGASLPPALARASVLALESHHGFGWAVKAALESGLVRTHFILVVQHDRAFMRPFDMARAIGCMQADEDVRYLLLPTRSTRHHEQTMLCNHRVRMPRRTIHGARLLTLAFWWDSTHLATAAHYRDFVFRERCARHGALPEETSLSASDCPRLPPSSGASGAALSLRIRWGSSC